MVAGRWQNLEANLGANWDGLATINHQPLTTASRKLYSLEQDQTFCPRLRRVDQASSCASGAMGDACVCGGGWLAHGPASGSDFRQLRLQRSVTVLVVCIAGLGWVGAR